MQELDKVIELLVEEKPLPDKYRDHALTGDYAGFRECHIQPDWLFLYAIDEENLILVAARTGTHSDFWE
jgi:mRNA interferase YafQ